jgi:drug/metabolite transporter (DMT)-like permease
VEVMPGNRISRWQWVGFFALCLLGASAGLVDDAWPSSLGTAERLGLHDLVIAIVLCGVAWNTGRVRLQGRPWMKVALASVCLLGVPVMFAEAAGDRMSGVLVTALFGLFPVMMVVVVSYVDLGGAESSGTNRLLVPTLIGLSGLLLVLPIVQPGSWEQAGIEAVVACGVFVAAVASVWMYRLLREFAVIEAAVICCAANAVFFFAVFVASRLVTRTDGGSEWSWRGVGVEAAIAILFGLPQILLLVWLLREMTPVRFAARYLVIPLLTVIEGYALVRPPITGRVIGGAVLVIFGAWRLMTASERGEEPGLMLS